MFKRPSSSGHWYRLAVAALAQGDHHCRLSNFTAAIETYKTSIETYIIVRSPSTSAIIAFIKLHQKSACANLQLSKFTVALLHTHSAIRTMKDNAHNETIQNATFYPLFFCWRELAAIECGVRIHDGMVSVASWKYWVGESPEEQRRRTGFQLWLHYKLKADVGGMKAILNWFVFKEARPDDALVGLVRDAKRAQALIGLHETA